MPMLGSQPYVPAAEKVQRVNLAEVAEEYKDTSNMDEAGGPQIVFRGIVENARAQGAKLTFITFRQGLDTIQAVVAESESLSINWTSTWCRAERRVAGRRQSSIPWRGCINLVRPQQSIIASTRNEATAERIVLE